MDESIPQFRDESVAVVEIFPQEPISERVCELIEVIEVTESASQDRNLQRRVEQMMDVTKIPDLDQGWQRTVRQFLDETMHEPISRISASIRELRRILSFFLRKAREFCSVASSCGGGPTCQEKEHP